MDKYNFEGKKIKSFSWNCNIELNFFENLSIEHNFTSKKSEFLKIIFFIIHLSRIAVSTIGRFLEISSIEMEHKN